MNKNNFSIYFYIKELTYHCLYFLASLFFCLIISFCNTQSLFLFETYPFLKFSDKKFIATHTTDLLDSIWILSISTSFLLVFPLFFYQLIQFSKTSWYNYQFYFAKLLLVFPLFFYWLFLLLCYFNILPLILSFLTQWETKHLNLILSIEIEFRILTYLNWILAFCYCFSFVIYLFSVLITQIIFLLPLKKIYSVTKIYRKQFCFLSISVLFFLAPPDFFLQFFLIFVAFISCEIIFFYLCYKISNKKL